MRLPLRVAIGASVIASLSSQAAVAQDNSAQALPLIGSSSGGTAFTRQCPDGQVLTGLRVRAGLVIDALGIKCRPVNANGSLGGENEIGAMAGGTGGVISSGSCPQGSVVAGQGGTPMVPTSLSIFELRCKRWDAAGRRWTGGVTAWVRVITASGAPAVFAIVSSPKPGLPGTECTRATQPVVLLRGRAGTLIDAAGFTCNEP